MGLRARQNGGGKVRNAGGRGGGNGSPGGRGNNGGNSATLLFNTSSYPSAKVSITNNNTTATRTASGTLGAVINTTVQKSSGKWYTEFLINNAASGSSAVGVANDLYNFSPSQNGYLGAVPNPAGAWSWGYWADGSKYYNGTPTASGTAYTNNDVIGMAWDADTGKLWFAKNNTWIGSGNPSAGTNAAFTSVTGLLAPAADVYAINASITVRSSSTYSYSPPSGFNAWEA